MMESRRDFLKQAAFSSAATVLAGCVAEGFGHVGGVAGPMFDYADKPFARRIRVGLVGPGRRGLSAVKRLSSLVSNVEVTALCDIVPWKCDVANRYLVDRGFAAAKVYTGPEGYKALCDDPNVDVVYDVSLRDTHVMINTYAMRAGKHVMTEVPGAMDVEGCWETVETAEKTRRHCMMLENYCYSEYALLAHSLAASGRLGEMVHADCAYVHEQRDLFRREPWRAHDSMHRQGNTYPTHGLGPVCKCMNINRGDRFDYLVSMDTGSISFREYQERTFGKGDWRRDFRMAHGDLNTTQIRTVKGKTIYVQHDVGLARPWTTINQLCGTRGTMRCQPDLRIALEGPDGPPKNALLSYMGEAETEKIRKDYMHPLWKHCGDLGVDLSVTHFGGDFLMDNRWAYCLTKGLPLDMNVYDLATWSSLVGLTAKSVANRSAAVDCPDFTCGAWKTAKPFELVDIPRSFLPDADTPVVLQELPQI